MLSAAQREVFEETRLRCTPLRVFTTSEVVDRDESSGVIRFHYVLLHVLATVDCDTLDALPSPSPASDVDEALWSRWRHGRLTLPSADSQLVPLCAEVASLGMGLMIAMGEEGRRVGAPLIQLDNPICSV